LPDGASMLIPSDLDICVVDPDPVLYNTLAPLFQSARARLRRFSTAEDLLAGCGPGDVHCVVAKALLPGISGIELIDRLRRSGSSAPVVLVVPPDDVDTAVAAMRSGALDVLEAPPPISRLLHTLMASCSGGEKSRRAAAPLDSNGA